MSADFKANVVDDLGNVQPASTVTVKDVNGALIPAGELFSDAALTIPFAANPFTTDAQGNMNFFIEPQTVNITAQKGAFVKTWDDYVLNEQIDTSDFATAAQGTLADSAIQPDDLGDIAGDNKTSPSATVWDDGNLVKTVGGIDTTAGSMMKVGDAGFLSGAVSLADYTTMENIGRIFRETSSTIGGSGDDTYGVLSIPTSGTPRTAFIKISGAHRFFVGSKVGAGNAPTFSEGWTTANTTVDINGFIKEV